MTSGERAWLVLAAGVVGWNLCAREGSMLSEAADDHPWLARGLGLVVYLHVANWVKPSYDPIHLLFSAAKGRV